MESPYFAYYITGDTFQLFSVSHLAVLLILFFFAWLLYRFRAAIRTGRANQLIRWTMAAMLLLSEIAFQWWHVITGYWSLAYMLPLQLCSVSLLLAVIMLVTRSYLLFEITYFWGLAGAVQAMLTPELFYPFPHFRFFHFFIAHILIILAVLHMTWVQQCKPTIRSVWKAFGALNLLLVLALIVNRVTGGNYLFVANKPSNPSLMDYLGPYPWYIVSLEGVAIGLFFLLYLPFAAGKFAKRVEKSTLDG